ncbi:type IX secretion system membrane protein PorP/SprF [Marinoscillum sp.]|uniref:PorP/SprF family type IX secretion system membrane protein n=1 Tax=Marinoscillum sp. TaxID=2024838 RepID=UPI003BAA758F
MKRFAISMMIFWGVYCAQAQNTPFFGHYMFNPTYFNPGWAGGESEAFVAFQHRSQWLGYSSSFDGSGGAPSTQMLTALVPVKNFPISSLGFNVINDNLGPITNLQAGLPLTYTQELRRGIVAVGVTPILFSQSLNTDLYRPNEPDDPIIPGGGRQTQIGANLNAGVFYRSNKGFFVGAGVQNILEPGFNYGVDGLDNKLAMTYAAHSGYTITIKDNLSISPTVLVRSDLKTVTFDLGGIMTIGERVWAGISYRRQESAILYLGYALMENKELKVGYSFDYVFVNQNAKAATTHEIFVRYDLPNLVFGGKKKVKTPRFSF